MSTKKGEDIKKVSCEVAEDVAVKLRILALMKRVTLQGYMREVLEKHVAGKGKQLETIEEN